MINWLASSWIHWFIDSLSHWLTDSRTVLQSFIDSLIHRLTKSIMHWFIVSLSHRFIDPFIDSLNHRFIDSYSFIGSLVIWFVDSMIHWFIASFILWSIDSWTYWFIASLVHQFIGSVVHSLSCAQVLSFNFLSFHFIGISTAICSFVDAPRNFNTSLLLHRINFPIGHWFPINNHVFETSAPWYVYLVIQWLASNTCPSPAGV